MLMLARVLFIGAEIAAMITIAGGIAMIFVPAGIIALGVMTLGLCIWQDRP